MPRDSLDAVYRLIASNSFLEAIHLLNKILKKQPNYLIAKVWKCEALHGLGNVAESEELMASILDQAPVDKRTLDSIADFYRARGNYSKLVEVYESALKSDMNDENWRRALFECCGLAGDYKKQHQQALHLYKQSPRMLFYCMAVVCLLQQADENPVALELAERMMVKQNDVNKLNSRNEVLLYITVLEKRGKFEEALAVLDKSAVELETIISTSDKRIELLLKLKRWPEVIKELKQKLQGKPDHWTYLKKYVHAVLNCEKMGGACDDAEVEDSTTRAYDFLQSLITADTKIRGPHLATIELHRASSGKGTQLQFVDLIVDYFHKFGTKAISVFDLSTYVQEISKSETHSLLTKLSIREYSTLETVEVAKRLGPLKHISFLQLSRLMGAHSELTVTEREKLCLLLEECYDLAGDCERREHYLLIMAHERLSLYRGTGDAKHLTLAACSLENALALAPLFSLQVVLLQIYFALGASKSARKLYEQLRIQSVQVDTLVHLFLYSISSTGHFTIASEMWESASKILQQCTAESLEALVCCYRAGLFHRVEEFTSCARRFQRTITVPLLRSEKAFLDIVSGEVGRAEQVLGRIRPVTMWEKCIDNRDVGALPTWEPPSSVRPREHSYAELFIFCKLREATLLCLHAAIFYGKQRLETEELAFKTSLDTLQSLYSEALTKTKTQFRGVNSYSTRLHLIVQIPLPSMLEKAMETDLSSSDKLCTLLKQSTDNMLVVVNQNKSKNPRLSCEMLVTELEALAVITVAMGVPRLSATSPAQRKRSGQIIQALQCGWLALEGCLPVAAIPDCEKVVAFKEIVDNKLRDNYASATDDLRKAIRKKITYLHKISNC